jgi:hypothetical protein
MKWPIKEGGYRGLHQMAGCCNKSGIGRVTVSDHAAALNAVGACHVLACMHGQPCSQCAFGSLSLLNTLASAT